MHLTYDVLYNLIVNITMSIQQFNEKHIYNFNAAATFRAYEFDMPVVLASRNLMRLIRSYFT
jgi:hypothetical protein